MAIPTATNKTALFSGRQPGGQFVVDDMAEHPGNIWFVDSGHAAASDTAGFGRSPEAPWATLDYAVGQCTANNGDVIYLMPGHAETYSSAGALDMDVAGIKVIGLGWGTTQPTITLDTLAAADVDIDAASVTFENVHFIAGVADIVAYFDVNSTDFTLRNCRLTGDNAGLNALIWIQDAAAAASSRITVEDCYVLDKDASNTHFINLAGTGDGHIIRNNVLNGDWGTMAVGGAGVVTNIVVDNNLINNAANTVDACVNLAATATGFVTRNLCGGAAAVANGITATGCTKAENYYQVLAADLSGLLDPPNV